MGETAAIVAAASGGLVGIGGLISAGWGGVLQRRWQSREERTLDLRTVLGNAAASFGRAMFTASEAQGAMEVRGELDEGLRIRLRDAHQGIVLAHTQVGVRCGPTSPESSEFFKCLAAFMVLFDHLNQAASAGIDDGRRRDILQAHSNAVDAERSYLAATAKALAPA